MLNTLGQFGGSPTENARQHLKSFLEICNSFKIHGVSNDVLKLKLFPFSLRDKAKAWLNNLQPGSLQSWTQLCRSFLAKFSYTNKTDHIRNQITSFRQDDDEAMHEAWERYRDLFRRCLMHGLPEWSQVSIFYNFVNTPTRMMLDASANGTLLDKPPREGLKILDKLVQNDYQHPTSRRGTTRRGPAQLDSSDTILAQIASLTNMVKNMQKQPHIQEVKALDAFCELCGNNHDASECGQNVETSCYVGNYNKNTMSNTYNPAWRNHPNFSWKNQNNTLNPQSSNQSGFLNQPRQNPQQLLPRQDYQPPADYKDLENTLTQFMAQTSAYMARTDRFIQKIDAFMDRTEMKLQNHDATLKSLETQVGQIPQILNTRPIGGFPSDTEVAKAASPSAATDTPAKADETTKTSEDHSDPHNNNKGESSAESSHFQPKESEDIRPPPPFPQRLKKQKQDYQFKKFFDILKQVHINLPLVEALQQMSNYAKFLKDKVPAKKRDPGSFTIECFIGHNYPTKALCDLGASINLMPKSVFRKLGIGEAKPTTADFLILDCEADEYAPIILGRPFLSTSRAIIDFDKDEIIFKVDDERVKMKSITK
ncbi:hypothetical protein V6N13_076248 [Hibiscus sabdariffa]